MTLLHHYRSSTCGICSALQETQNAVGSRVGANLFLTLYFSFSLGAAINLLPKQRERPKFPARYHTEKHAPAVQQASPFFSLSPIRTAITLSSFREGEKKASLGHEGRREPKKEKSTSLKNWDKLKAKRSYNMLERRTKIEERRKTSFSRSHNVYGSSFSFAIFCTLATNKTGQISFVFGLFVPKELFSSLFEPRVKKDLKVRTKLGYPCTGNARAALHIDASEVRRTQMTSDLWIPLQIL